MTNDEREAAARADRGERTLIVADTHHVRAPPTMHHTLGGSVLRLSPLKKAQPSRKLIDRFRDFFLLW